jgi:hypothetical protein
MFAIVSLLVVFLLFCIAVYYCLKFAIIILRVQDAIEESIDIIDNSYNSINKILEIPLMYDSPQIRQVQIDIKKSRDSIMVIADKLINATKHGNKKEISVLEPDSGQDEQ